MGAMFTTGSVGNNAMPAPIVAAATPAAPRGPQLAPGQQVPGGPVMPGETEEERQRRLLAARMNSTILGDPELGWGNSGDGAGANGTASGNSASGGAAAAGAGAASSGEAGDL